jgi:hypothetical protein
MARRWRGVAPIMVDAWREARACKVSMPAERLCALPAFRLTFTA